MMRKIKKTLIPNGELFPKSDILRAAWSLIIFGKLKKGKVDGTTGQMSSLNMFMMKNSVLLKSTCKLCLHVDSTI